ncbi:hypothetical protein WA026_014444 [Henosepilachna vigintioctopunctata]|uniref:Uncharacterized protein n=1 Tax=Henosepilachna vigintioctopunctata TaxID=420089 RepID=A0AAW1UMS4_9CUCU
MSEISQENFDEILDLKRSSSNREIQQAFKVLATNCNFDKHTEISEKPTDFDMLTRKIQASSDKEVVYDSDFYDDLLRNLLTNDQKLDKPVKLKGKCGAPQDQYTKNNHITPDNSRNKGNINGNRTTIGVSNHTEISEEPIDFDMLTRKIRASSDKEVVYDSDFYDDLLRNFLTNDQKPEKPVKLEEKCCAPPCQCTDSNHITPDNIRKKGNTDCNRTTFGVSTHSKHRIRVTFTDTTHNPFRGCLGKKRLYCFLTNYGYIRGLSFNYGTKREALVDYEYRSAAELAINMESKYQNKFMKLEWENGPPPPSDDPVDEPNFSMYVPFYECVHYYVEKVET